MVSASRGGSRVVHAELVMKRRGAKPLSDAQRLRQRHPPSASLSSRGQEEGGGGEGGRGEGGEKGRGDVMPKRLKSGFGHHRLESCGPSNGRDKIA